MIINGLETYYPTDRQQWRNWLKKHHSSKGHVWLLYYRKSSGVPTISWSEAVSEALCFGWVDSTKKTIDDQRFIQFFTQRKPKSTWSKINKDKIDELIGQGLMTTAGLDSVNIAKQNGAWDILNDIEGLEIPKDLAKAFRNQRGSKKFFLSLSKSARKSILQWIVLAKRAETREKRIHEIAELAAQGLKPKQF